LLLPVIREENGEAKIMSSLARLSHLEGVFDYFRPETGIKLNVCNSGMSETVAVKTLPL
jgi:hypothetical protein